MSVKSLRHNTGATNMFHDYLHRIRLAISTRPRTSDQSLSASDQSIVDFYEQTRTLGWNSSNKWVKRSAKIPGWLFEKEHEFIYEMCMSSPDGNFIEIGVLFGKSTSIIAGAVEDRGRSEKVFAIDPFSLCGNDHDKHVHNITHGLKCSFQLFQEQAIQLNYLNNVIPIAAYSQECLPFVSFQAGFALIDGCHELNDVILDFSLIYPKLVPGAIVLFHDAMTPCGTSRNTAFPGVIDAIDQIKCSYPGCSEVGAMGSIVALQCKQA